VCCVELAAALVEFDKLERRERKGAASVGVPLRLDILTRIRPFHIGGRAVAWNDQTRLTEIVAVVRELQ